MLQNVYNLADFHSVSKTESKLYKARPHAVWDKTVNMLRKECFSYSTELETHLTQSVLKRKIPKMSLLKSLWPVRMISALTMNHYHLSSCHSLQMSLLQRIHHPCMRPLISSELRALHYNISSLLHLLFFTKWILPFLHQYSLLCWFGNRIHYCLLLCFFTGNGYKKPNESRS